MAVPKRKMSRSNTRHRRSQWKAVAPTLVTCANPACGAKHLPHRACGDLRPVRRPRRPSPGPLTRSPALTNYGDAPRGARGSGPGPRAARARPDPPLVRLRERRAADQRAAGVPRRLRARRRRHRDALPHPPDLSEGRLAKLRAAVVNARALAEVGRDIGLGDHIKLGRGEEATGGRDKASILSDTVEAVIGAVHLSGGFEASGAVVHLLFDPLIEAAAALGAGLDWKTSLQELSAEHGLGVPEYVIAGRGPRPREDLHRPGAGRRPTSTATASAAPRRKPSRTPPRRRTASLVGSRSAGSTARRRADD